MIQQAYLLLNFASTTCKMCIS